MITLSDIHAELDRRGSCCEDTPSKLDWENAIEHLTGAAMTSNECLDQLDDDAWDYVRNDLVPRTPDVEAVS